MPITEDEFKEKYPVGSHGDGFFDEHVDAAKGAEATEINNAGHKEQVRYLLERIGPEMLDIIVGN